MFLIPVLSEYALDLLLQPEAESLGLAEALVGAKVSLPAIEPWDVGTVPASLSGAFPWRLIYGTSAWGVVNDAAELHGTGSSSPTQVGRLLWDTGQNDLRLTLLIEEWYDSGGGLLVVGPCFRMQGDDSFTYYAPTLISLNGVPSLSIQRFMNQQQQQIGPAIPVVPHAGMTIGIQGVGSRLSLYFDEQRVYVTDDPGGIASGHFVGLQGVATLTNRVRATSLLFEQPSAEVRLTPADALALVESLQRRISRGLAETIELSEAQARQAVLLRPLGEPLGLAETLAAATARPHTGKDTVGLFEQLGIEFASKTPYRAETVSLTEALTPKVTGRVSQEVVALTESLGRIFRPQTHVGILQLVDEFIGISGGTARERITTAGLCRLPVQELTGLEYAATLVGRDGVVVGPGDLAMLQITLYNLGDLAIINGIDRLNALNLGKGTLSDAGRLVITLDAVDTPVLDPTKSYEHHVLLIEGSYDGALRAFRRTVDHVVMNLARVP